METTLQQGSPILLLGLRRQLLQVWHVLERCPRFFAVAFSREGLGCARGRTLIWGKFRRFVLTAFPPLARRLRARYHLSGGCENCGASCNLLFRCPHWDARTHLCTVYEDRPNVCRFFPVTPADLRDRNLARKDVPCGFKFSPQHYQTAAQGGVLPFPLLRAGALRSGHGFTGSKTKSPANETGAASLWFCPKIEVEIGNSGRKGAPSPHYPERRLPMYRKFAVFLVFAFLPAVTAGQSNSSEPRINLPGLREEGRIVRDTNGIAHIRAHNKHDLFLLQGYVHAQDRLFQMDVSRREASGTLAELLGPAALPEDVQLRTLGLRRAAERSFPVISRRARAALAAYAEGVNAFVAANPLPPEYRALELSKFEPWTPIDSLAVAKLISFGLSFDLDIEPTVALLSYQQAGQALGFDGTKLFFQDLDRSAPFDPASTIPDASVPRAVSAAEESAARRAMNTDYLHPRTIELAKDYMEKVKDMPVFQRLHELKRSGGSNEWAISGALTETGVPLLANDPHLALVTPSTFYPIHLEAEEFDVIGNGFAGIPTVIIGHNKFISWGATVNPMDVTDTFQEQIVLDGTSPSGLSTVHGGNREPIIPSPEVFRQNNIGDGILDNVTSVPPGGAIPQFTLIVPRRNNGPLIALDLAHGLGLSVQYTGFSGTRELDTFLIWDGARNLNDFIRGLRFFSVGSQNFAFSDIEGNIAYFTSAEMPIREDLQAGVVNGLPPFFIRNGTGGNEWLPVIHPQPHQAIPFEILPFAEMPHILNPAAGFFVNSNNDPIGITLDNNPLNQFRPGGGIFYLNYTYSGGFRAGRITQLIKQKLSRGSGKISLDDMQAIQADVTLLDAQVFVPHITRAFANARATGANPALAALGADPGVVDAVRRLSHWDFTTPTGIPEGFDASRLNGQLSLPSSQEIAASVAATIYSVWRGQFITNTIDAVLARAGLPKPVGQEALKALRNLLDNFSINGGMGASGVNFFNVPGVTRAGDRRDIVILQSLAAALALLRGPNFVHAFANSTNLDDYRWGKLHRIVFAHRLDGPFSIPPAGGAFPQPLPNLPGIPTDGGFETVDASTHDARAASENGFMFGSGPNARFVSEATEEEGMRAVSALPGGTSGIPGSPFYFNLLLGWLTNDAFPLLFREEDIEQNTFSVTRFAPPEEIDEED